MAEAKKVSIEVDGRVHRVDETANLLEACLGAGLDLPYFCWHPALGSVGACRQCAVQQFRDPDDRQGRVVMACMTPCSEGARFALDHPEAEAMRRAVVEFLMTNHPHDCPVCEEGGHCHLQDMTVMTGHSYRRYRFAKRTHRNQDLGPFVNHEMNRCIACYRCVRFYRDYAGGTDLDVFGAHNDVYFGRAEDGVLESPFSGNLVEVCPTGVFTDKPYGERYTRKWDLQTAPSVCVHCSLGCNTSPGERYGRLRRVENRYHGEVNGYFLCDRGRYGWGFVNREDRPREVRRRGGEGGWEPESPERAAQRLASLLSRGGLVGIGSPRASLEANYALRALVGETNFHRGEPAAEAELADLGLDLLRRSGARIASLADVERADAVLLLGEDVLSTAARLALALRQSVRQAGFRLAEETKVPLWQDDSVRTLAQELRSPLYLAVPAATGLEDVAAGAYTAPPLELAWFGMAVAHALDAEAPAVGLEAEAQAAAEEVAAALAAAERPLVVSGTGCRSRQVLQAAGNVVAALARSGRSPALALAFAECNSAGSTLLGGDPLEAALERMASGEVETAIVLENDLGRRVDRELLEAALARVPHLVVLDSIATPMQEWADTVLPAGSFAESDGTLVNHEGRAQRFFQVFAPREPALAESWRWLQRIARAAGRDDLGDGLDALTRACASAVPELAGIVAAAPDAGFRVAGAKVRRQPPRASGRTAMHANLDPHEPQPPADPDSPLAFSMEGAPPPVPALLSRVWAPGWNSPQAINKFQQEIGGALRGGDPGVRLLVPSAKPDLPYFSVPEAADGAPRVLPLYHLFGSEELSAAAPVMRERIPAPYLALHPATALELGLAQAERVDLRYAGGGVRLPLALRADLPRRCVGLPLGLPGVPVLAAGAEVALLAVGAP